MFLKRYFMLILCALNLQKGERCRLNTRIHFGEPLPVIIRNGRLLEPTDKFGNVDINFGENLLLSCEGGGSISHPNSIVSMDTASITCDGGQDFKNNVWLNASSQFNLFRCPVAPPYRSQRTSRTCFEGNTVIEVGYSIQNEFFPLFETCFNENTLAAVYSMYTQKPYNAMYQTRVDRPYFIDTNNYGTVPVDWLYRPKGLTSAVGNLVGKRIHNYFTFGEILSRGHLAAKTDFVFAFGERATFHYVNCAAQWKNFNGGNWNTLEVDLRNHIHDVEYNTIIYTGTYGVSQLVNENDDRVDLYLYRDVNNNPVMPVPQYYYKVVYEPSSRRGIVFVGINNPYLSREEAEPLYFCKDVCRGNMAFSWLTWHPDVASEGYSFCCSVSDFRNIVRHIPHFEVSDLLT